MATPEGIRRPAPFNISLNLGTFLSLPSRFLARLKLIDTMLTEDAARLDMSNIVEEWGSGSSATLPEGGPPPSFTPFFPGPWGFITSGYALGLFAMVFLLHRIQNVVVPPRRPQAHDILHDPSRRLSPLGLLYHLILPINLSSTFSRALIFFPTMYFLSKAMLLWVIILLQTAEFYPTVDWYFVIKLGEWAGKMEFGDICWFTYWTICAAFCVEAFVKGLEGTTNQHAINTSPFNLCGYAFLLHVYSSPVTHTVLLPGQATRPDKHVIATITIPLLQLWMIHVLGVKQSLSQLRLVPTGISSLLSLVHFHVVLWRNPRSYPLLNYMSCVFDTFLLSATALTAILNGVTQILLEGSITRPLLAPSAALNLSWEDDFAVVLLRLGTASLEATKLAGLGNELGGISAGEATSTPAIELNRFGVVMDGQEGKGAGIYRGRVNGRGFANEIKDVRVTRAGDAEVWLYTVWYRELTRYFSALWSVPKDAFMSLWAIIRGKRRHRSPRHDDAPIVVDGWEGIEVSGDGNEAFDRKRGSERDPYERFLRGETLSDESDTEFEPPPPRNRSPSLAPSLADSIDGSEEQNSSSESEEDEDEAAVLYADHLTATSASTSTAPLLLAHFTDPSASPLTRRRYTRLVNHARSPTPEAESRSILRRRREAQLKAQPPSAEDEARRNCVICTIEPRQIICWPCRCLALCDECRANLGSRSSASKHRCPCCRRTVDGYSKIYIP